MNKSIGIEKAADQSVSKLTEYLQNIKENGKKLVLTALTALTLATGGTSLQADNSFDKIGLTAVMSMTKVAQVVEDGSNLEGVLVDTMLKTMYLDGRGHNTTIEKQIVASGGDLKTVKSKMMDVLKPKGKIANMQKFDKDNTAVMLYIVDKIDETEMHEIKEIVQDFGNVKANAFTGEATIKAQLSFLINSSTGKIEKKSAKTQFASN
jgi:hypothetical protein